MKKNLAAMFACCLIMVFFVECATVPEEGRDIILESLSEDEINSQTSTQKEQDDIIDDGSKNKNDNSNYNVSKDEVIVLKDSSYDMSKGTIPKVYIENVGEIGREAYVPASVKIMDESGQYGMIDVVNAQIKVRGHSSALGAKKPYNIKLDNKRDVLGLGKSKKWSLIANLYDPSRIRNELALEFARNMNIPFVSNSQYVEVYVNGEYCGLYLLTEPVETGRNQVNIEKDEKEFLLEFQPNESRSGNPVIKTNIGIYFSVNNGEASDTAYVTKFINNFEHSLGKPLEEVSKYANIDSFVDYYVFSELIKDVDFATSSSFFYIKDNILYAGPVWDFDLSMGNAGDNYPEYNNVQTTGNSYEGFYCDKYWFLYLTKNEEFMKLVKERFNELQPLIENLTNDNILGKSRMDNLVEKYRVYFEKDNQKWDVSIEYSLQGMQRKPMSTFDENCLYLKQWIIQRNSWLKTQWGK